uniref:ABC transporter E family member 2-like n=1 Tax=Dermatophagoides pteronyssinus TaxID=6956 RepID=A0A6P6YIM2_DERPT|nr:ABC transporter E family member 2-like [Dermatophagoides pteronyssinus]
MAKKTDVREDARLRIAIVNSDRCKPKKCSQECRRYCPVVRTGKQCIIVTPASKQAAISEILCIGCGICVKKCPFDAIQIINLPKDLSKETSHRFGQNSFKLHRLPMPRPGIVLGLLGRNGMGKTTALAILSGRLKPNLGNFEKPPSWNEIVAHYRGSELQNYLRRLQNGDLSTTVKPQYVDDLARRVKKSVSDVILNGASTFTERMTELIDAMAMQALLERKVFELSGGELQRFAILVAILRNTDVLMFDEPSSYLDIKQRMMVARLIRAQCSDKNFIICVEHDLAICDYLSDVICCLWGHASAYGVISTPYGVKEGINVYLEGFLPSENLRFREESLQFKIRDEIENEIHDEKTYKYPAMRKTLGDFVLHVEAGHFSNSQITVLVGENGTGKSTFIRLLAGLLSPDEAEHALPNLVVSTKPQMVTPKFEGTVNDLLLTKIRESYTHPQFITDCVKPLGVDKIKDLQVQTLSGGELQRVALILALGKSADIYLLDEPSAYLDCETRIEAAKVIKRFIFHAKKTAFVVEHDFIMATYLADRVLVYEGRPGVECHARSPQSLVSGMNRFLKMLDTTFRRDMLNFRPRINKADSVKDREQKAAGNFFVVDND